MQKQYIAGLSEKMYPNGLEIEFTSDGKYIFPGKITDYKILDDTTMEVEGDFVERLHYELPTDAHKIYYHGKDHAVRHSPITSYP